MYVKVLNKEIYKILDLVGLWYSYKRKQNVLLSTSQKSKCVIILVWDHSDWYSFSSPAGPLPSAAPLILPSTPQSLN